MLRKRSLFLGLAIAATLMPFSFAFEGSRITFLMIRDSPANAGAFLVAAIAFWIVYWTLSRRLRSSGL